MTLEHIILGLLGAMVVWSLIAMFVPSRKEPESPVHRQPTPSDVLPCLHDWTRWGYCATCGEQTQAMKQARRRHPSTWRDAS